MNQFPLNIGGESGTGSWAVGARAESSPRGSTQMDRVSSLSETTPLKGATHILHVAPEDSVYSYLMFMPPIEQRRTRRYMTPLTGFAFMLVFANFIMQFLLLTFVGTHIKIEHAMWVGGLTHLHTAAWYHYFSPMSYNKEPSECRGEEAPLCFERGDGITCAPPSLQLLENWNDLDRDRDGVWTREEAMDKEYRDKVMCKYTTDSLQVFEYTLRWLNQSGSLEGRRDRNLFNGQGIHKAYFDLYMHKPLLCMYGDEDMCGVLFVRGFFDEALKQESLPAFTDTARAMRYCDRVLKHDCTQMMPDIYKVWRKVANQQCGEKSYADAMVSLPGRDKDLAQKRTVLSVNFRKPQQYEEAVHGVFRYFLMVLLIVFEIVMFLELKSIGKSFAWVWRFPRDDPARRGPGDIVSRDAVIIDKVEDKMPTIEEEDAEEPMVAQQEFVKTIRKIRTDHRMIMLIITILRSALWCLLVQTGIIFLTGEPKYLNLIFDALSIVFIFEIDELLYRTILRPELRNDHFSANNMLVPLPSGISMPRAFHGLELSLWPDIIAFFCLVGIAYAIVAAYLATELEPLYDALSCVCSVEGTRCREAVKYTKAWWDNYWTRTLPEAAALIDSFDSVQ